VITIKWGKPRPSEYFIGYGRINGYGEHNPTGSVAKNSESMLKAFPQTQIPGGMY